MMDTSIWSLDPKGKALLIRAKVREEILGLPTKKSWLRRLLGG